MYNQSLKLVSSGLLLFGALTLACSDTNSQGGGAGGSSSGGSSAGGAGTGGKVGSGGAVSTGGTADSGGSKGSGGAVGTGGASSSGGKSGSGGAVSSGGSAPAGGSMSSGGATSPGGAPGSGGGFTRDGGPGGQTGSGGSGSGGSTGVDAGTTSGRSAGCGKAPTIPSSSFNNATSISITAANMQRRYILNVPTNYDNTKAYRLVVTLHARDGNDKQMHDWKYYGLLSQAKDDSIFVAPNGQLNGKPCAGTGIGEGSCGWPNSNGSDLALVDAVVAQMQENFCIDTNRIVATGWSYGGSMSYAVACERPLGGTKASWGVRAIAIYAAAQLSGSCTPSMPVAYYHSHGTKDSVLNYDSMGLPLAQNFAKANGCTWATPTKVTSGTHVCANLSGCKTGYPLEFCSFNGDHTPFPDNGQSQGSWGPPEAWKFLTQF